MRIIVGMSTNKKQTRQWGATFGFYAPRGSYSSPEAREEIDALAATGANWVIVVVTVWQDEATSTFQYRDCALTPDDLELAEIVAYARSKGLKVQLRPMLECKDGLGRLDYIFVSRGTKVKSIETVGDPRPGMQTYPSDHFPVVSVLELPQAETDAK